MMESFRCPRLWAWSPVLGKPLLSLALEQPPAERRKSARGNAVLTYTAEAGNGAGTPQQQPFNLRGLWASLPIPLSPVLQAFWKWHQSSQTLKRPLSGTPFMDVQVMVLARHSSSPSTSGACGTACRLACSCESVGQLPRGKQCQQSILMRIGPWVSSPYGGAKRLPS